MSSQVRRDTSRFNPQNSQQTWVPRGASTSVVVVNEPSLNADAAPYYPGNLERQHHGSRHPNYNQQQRSNVVGPPPPNRQSRSNSLGTMSDNGQRVASRTGRLNQGKRVATEENIVLTDPNLPQLVQEIQEKLVKSSIECMICYDKVGRSANIWSCSSCYSIFHLHCIKRWARAPTSIDLLAEKNQGDNWRCPGCQSVQFSSSKELCYWCFCGKRKDPPPDPYVTPHSCGEPCGKPLDKEFATAEPTKEDVCPHVCVLQCHPGPCPPCKAFAPPRSCPCGKKMTTTRCSERRSALVCEQRCDKLLNCGRHRCERTCHVGPCNPCQVLVNATCFCKRKVETVICGDMNVKGELKAEDGVHSCSFKCGKLLGCGNHFCSDVCHPGPCGDCDLLPSKVKTCYCGKTRLGEQIRQSCLDSIPSCSNICRKFLPCGLHTCNEVCHVGECPPCLVQVNEKCRCSSTSRTVECYITTSSDTEKFICPKTCGLKKNCGRHRCSERCCPLLNANKNDTSNDWDPHVCQLPCEKKLRCGQHSCESLCHSGHCPPCLEMIFSDLTCACGRTSIPPPLPCGTPIPSCQLPCSIPQPCGHSATHGCHFGDCPPCSAPVEKKCVGGHVVLGNRPCGLKLSCDDECAKLARKRVLQDAPENFAMTGIISDIYKRDPKWVLAIEERFKFMVLGKARVSTNTLKVHVFCSMQKDKRDAVRFLGERWKLAVSNAGWEPKRFTVVHVTQKSKPPKRIIGARSGRVAVGTPHPPSFDPLVDMDPGLVVSLLDLPKDANITALALRFGGECELVWLNDKNALAVFHDHARAATAMRRLDHSSVYRGAVTIQNSLQSPSLSNAWGKLPSSSAGPWKKAVIQECDDSIGGSSTNIQASLCRSATSNTPVAASVNRWNVLEPEKPNTSAMEPLARTEGSSSSKATGKQPVGDSEYAND